MTQLTVGPAAATSTTAPAADRQPPLMPHEVVGQRDAAAAMRSPRDRSRDALLQQQQRRPRELVDPQQQQRRPVTRDQRSQSAEFLDKKWTKQYHDPRVSVDGLFLD